MINVFRQYPRAATYAVLVHLVLVILVTLSLDFKSHLKDASENKVNIVNAVAVDESKVQEEIQRLEQIEKKKAQNQKAESERLEKLKEQAKREEQRIADLKQKRAEEEKKRKEQEVKAKKEAERLAKLKKEKAELEAKRKAEQKRLEEIATKRKIEEEQKKKAEAARVKAEEEARRVAAEQALKEQLAEEQRQLQAAQAARLKSLREKYVLSIRNKVRSKWIRPPNVAGNASCKVGVQQIPGGEVINVTVTSCDGNDALKRSVELAVYKASPLPSPPVAELFDRDIEFTFIAGE